MVKYKDIMTTSSDVNASDGVNFIANDQNRYITLWTFPHPDRMINASKNTHYARKVKIGTDINLGEYLNSLKMIKGENVK